MEITCSDFYSNPDGKFSIASSFEAETIFFRLDNESKINVTIDNCIFSSLNDNLYTGKQFKDVKLKKKSKNKNLNKAREDKKDEFYTQYKDAYDELKEYAPKYKGKVVYCPCDNPNWSVFVQVFKDYFHEWGLKGLISSSYPEGLVEFYDGKNCKYKQGIDGDFRTDSLIQQILKKCDIIATNPPFSLFREFVKTITDLGKGYIIMGNQNAIGCKEVWKHIADDTMRVGKNFNKALWFRVPDHYEAKKIDENGIKYCQVPGICWYTNLNLDEEREWLDTGVKYDETKYKKFINYDVLNTKNVKEIPMDYDGPMGVPITFIKKYNPKQFRIRSANELRTNQETPCKEHGLIKDSHGILPDETKPTYVRFVIEKIKKD